MRDTGYIKLHRSLLEWEWWDDHNATRLLIYFLVKVNWVDKRWKGDLIKAGSLVTSWEHISIDTGMSKQQVRTASEKLENSKEITRKTTNKYQLISLVKWDKLQSDINNNHNDNTQRNTQVTLKQQANNTQVTPTKEREEYKEGKEEGKIPSLDEVKKYFQENRYSEQGAIKAYEYYQASIEGKRAKYWRDSKGNPVKNWKMKMRSVWFKDEYKLNNGVDPFKKSKLIF